jgi:L-ribulose-5-phosphate 3-epimerase
MRLGVRAHDFGKRPAAELAAHIARKGFSCVQLAPPKAIAGFEAEPGRLNADFARQVKSALAQERIEIAVLGCYINLVDPDPAHRRHQLDRFKDYLRFARDFGCPVVGTETGSLNADYSFHPDNRGEAAFQTVVTGVRELVAEAEQCGAMVGIEGVERYVISDPPRMQRLLATVESPHLVVIFDAVNLLSVENHGRQVEIMQEAFALWGDRIAIIHAKDFVVENGRLRSVLSGQGMLDHRPLVEFIRQRKPEVPVLMEDTDPATVERGVRFWRDFFPEPAAPRR